MKKAKQVFKYAVRKRLLLENPLQDVKAGKQDNRKRDFFVTREMAQRLLDACPDSEWRLIVALARFFLVD